jgi:hypothetical protein
VGYYKELGLEDSFKQKVTWEYIWQQAAVFWSVSKYLSINTSDSKNSILLPSQRKGIANIEHVRHASVPHVVTKYHLLIRQCAKCIVVCDSEEFDHKSSILN